MINTRGKRCCVLIVSAENNNPQSTSIYYKNVQTLPWKQSERHIHEHDSLLSSCASMFVLNLTPVPTGEICNGGGQFPQNCSF